MILHCLRDVVASEAGAGRVLLGGDVARASGYRSYNGFPGARLPRHTFYPPYKRCSRQFTDEEDYG